MLNRFVPTFAFAACASVSDVASSTPSPASFTIEAPGRIVAGGPASIRFQFRAGEKGLAAGDTLEIRFPLAAPFPKFQWADPQTKSREETGFVSAPPGIAVLTAPCPAIPICRGEALRLTKLYPPIVLAVLEKGLAPGDSIDIVYGDAGPTGRGLGRAQPFPEESATWHAFIREAHRASASDPTAIDLGVASLEVGRALPARLYGSGAASATRGRPQDFRVAALDSLGFAASRFPEGVRVRAVHESGAVIAFGTPTGAAGDPCAATVLVTFDRVGLWWLETELDASARAITPAWPVPILVEEPGEARHPVLVFGDLHWHSNRSDGSRSPSEGYRYARDVVGLDFAAKTDHDLHFLYACMDESAWRESETLVREFEKPGRFAALLGWEWTYPNGHQNVIFRTESGPYRPVFEFASPEFLWASLDPGSALTIPHHPAGGGTVPSMNWNSFDARFVKAVEIFSSHGDGEAPDGARRPMKRTKEGPKERASKGSAQEALARGYEFAFLASSDNHTATPGNPARLSRRDLDGGTGLCAAWVDTLSREGVFDAVAAGRTYATTGPRFRIELAPSGRGIEGRIVAANDLSRVELLGGRKGSELPFAPIAAFPFAKRVCDFRWSPSSSRDSALTFVYIRATQADGEMAWSSPVFFDGARRPEDSPR